MELKNKLLSHLEKNCLDHLSIAYEYLTDWHYNDEDYSKEFIINETLYAFEVFKRASNDNLNNNPDYLYVQNCMEELFNSLEILNFENKFHLFIENYFNEERYDTLLNDLNNKIVDNKIIEEDTFLYDNMAIDYFLIYDKINCLKQSTLIQKNCSSISNYLSEQNSKLFKIFNQYENVWEYFHGLILSESKSLLIPNNTLEHWGKFSVLSSDKIEFIIGSYLKNKKQELIISHILRNVIPKKLNTVKQSVINLVPEFKHLSNLNNIIDDVFFNATYQPSFSTYSKTNNLEDLNVNDWVKAFSEHTNNIDNIIDSIEQLDITDEKKNNLIIAIYILFNEHNKAIKLSK